MKKKVKKSGAMNFLTIRSCSKSPNFIKQVAKPGKPPPNAKQKQSPNYMRSTSSFEARKEKSMVSSQASVKGPKQNFKNSKVSSNSGHKPAKKLTRTSSLDKVRTSTKAPNFKPIKAANQKCSQVVLCDDLKLQRAICSSTLKVSRFPNYLEHRDGATVSEGTSLKKMCPYTYCSFNGHIHAPSPPLKCFLSAERHMLKAQKNIKMGFLSQRKSKPYGDPKREISEEVTVHEKVAIQESGVQEDQIDFYIEIYDKNREDDFETDSICKASEVEADDVSGKVEDGFFDDAPNSAIAFESNLDNLNEVASMRSDVIFIPREEHKLEEAKETPESVRNQREMEHNGTDSETYDMEWDEGQHPTLLPANENSNPANDKIGYYTKNSSSFNGNNGSLFDKNILSICCFDEIPVGEGEEVFDQSGDDETESISNNEDETIKSVEDNEASSPKGNQLQYHLPNNSQVFELDVCEEVYVEEISCKIKHLAANRSLEQEMQEKEKNDANESDISVPNFALFGDLLEDNQDMTKDGKTDLVPDVNRGTATNGESNEASDDKCLYIETYIHSFDEESKSQNHKDMDTNQVQSFNSLYFIDSENQAQSGLNKEIATDKINTDIDVMEEAYSGQSDHKESFSAENKEKQKQAKTAFTRGGGNSSEEQQNNTNNLPITKREKSEELEKEREFNPHEPNYLSVKPDPGEEKVHWEHQDLDDRKKAKEWMIDYALQQTVNGLDPAQKRKVALLVEAFEKVMPPHYDPHLKDSPSAFAPARPIQSFS